METDITPTLMPWILHNRQPLSMKKVSDDKYQKHAYESSTDEKSSPATSPETLPQTQSKETSKKTGFKAIAKKIKLPGLLSKSPLLTRKAEDSANKDSPKGFVYQVDV